MEKQIKLTIKNNDELFKIITNLNNFYQTIRMIFLAQFKLNTLTMLLLLLFKKHYVMTSLISIQFQFFSYY
jgi:hypothetical protein